MQNVDSGQSGRRAELLPTWVARDPRDRRLHLTDLKLGLEHLPARLIRDPVVPSRNAGVLIPVFDEGDGLHVILIERGHDVGTHRGDIAFPGGTCETGERASAAAVRETEEEIGIPTTDVEVIASLSTHPTLTGFVIWPYIGALAARPLLRPNAPEVARVLVVALEDLVADGAWSQRPWPSEEGRLLDHFAVEGGTAWGTTGDLLRELLEICIIGRMSRPQHTALAERI